MRKLALLYLLLATTPLFAQESPLPNIVLILSDDLGYSDLSCYGSEIPTPELDALAKNGLRFTHFYNTGRCWPTRAAILTGYYAQQVRRDAIPGEPGPFGVRATRPAWGKLLPELLKEAGYRSYHSGKWHVDGAVLAGGFDRSYSLNDHDRFFTPKNHLLDDKPLPQPKVEDGYYASTAIAQHAIDCLSDHAKNHADKPFLSFVAFTAPHFPLQAPAADIAQFNKTYQSGWDAMREKRWKRLQELPLTGASLSAIERDLGPPYAFPDAIKKLGPNEVNRPVTWESLNAEQQKFQAEKMAVHAAMVARMDAEIGRVVKQLQTMKALDNTLLVFLSDNGASAEMMVRGDGHDPCEACGTGATFLSIGPGWSSLANTPFRRHKTWVHEGGTATPFIVHWPAGIPAKNEVRHSVGHVIDFVPTVLEAAGIHEPELVEGQPPRPGQSLLPYFKQDAARETALWWLHEKNRALRKGDWKIVASGEKAAWELYNLKADRCETNDLATTEPNRVKALAAEWEEFLEAHKKAAAAK